MKKQATDYLSDMIEEGLTNTQLGSLTNLLELFKEELQQDVEDIEEVLGDDNYLEDEAGEEYDIEWQLYDTEIDCHVCILNKEWEFVSSLIARKDQKFVLQNWYTMLFEEEANELINKL